jgi:type IV pilus assembly protein PilE
MHINKLRKLRGFTLIELMIVIVIVGLLAAIAWPQYQGFVRKTRATDAQADLLELASFMERTYTVNNGYLTAPGGAVLLFGDLPFTDNRRGTGGTQYYQYRLGGMSATTFTLRAIPKNDQIKFTGCGVEGTVMQLRHTGVTLPSPGCWK